MNILLSIIYFVLILTTIKIAFLPRRTKHHCMTSYIVADEGILIKLFSRNKNYNYLVNDKFIETVIIFQLCKSSSKLKW